MTDTVKSRGGYRKVRVCETILWTTKSHGRGVAKLALCPYQIVQIRSPSSSKEVSQTRRDQIAA